MIPDVIEADQVATGERHYERLTLMVTSAGKVRFDSTSTALIIPTGTGQAVWLQN